MLVDCCSTRSSHWTPEGRVLGQSDCKRPELVGQQQDAASEKKVLQEPLYHGWIVPRINQLVKEMSAPLKDFLYSHERVCARPARGSEER